MEDDPIPDPSFLVKVGGMVDKSHVSLAIYGDGLDPHFLSRVLGCVPTRSHRKGDRKTPTSPEFKTGAWILTLEGRAPRGPSHLIEELLRRLPSDGGTWRMLTEKYKVFILVAAYTGEWNRGFDLPAGTVAALAQRSIGVSFDLYFYGDKEAVDPN